MSVTLFATLFRFICRLRAADVIMRYATFTLMPTPFDTMPRATITPVNACCCRCRYATGYATFVLTFIARRLCHFSAMRAFLFCRAHARCAYFIIDMRVDMVMRAADA